MAKSKTQFPLPKKGSLTVNPIGAQVTMRWRGKELLGDVVGVHRNPVTGAWLLTVRHFDGSFWPVEPTIGSVEVLVRDDAMNLDRAGKSGLRQYATNQRWLRGEISTQEHDADALIPPLVRQTLDLLMGRVTYEDGRFLLGDIVNLPKATKDAIDAYLVKIEHPLAYEPGTQDYRIAKLAREWVGRSDRRLPPGTPDPRD